MPRVVSIFLPSWPTDGLRRKLGVASLPPDGPFVLAGRDGQRRVVLAADRAALAAGLRVGMPATKAQALVEKLIMMDADPDGDAEALDRLALWAMRRYSPEPRCPFFLIPKLPIRSSRLRQTSGKVASVAFSA